VEITNFIQNCVSKYFTIKSVYREPKTFYFIVYDYNREKFLQLVRDLDKIGYLPFIDEFEENYKINIVKKPEHGESNVHTNAILFLVTIISTVFAGYVLGGNILDGIAFSIAILAIIGTHETAHFFAARKHGVKATLPYFIPSPFMTGTMGAVINVKSAIPDKNALFDLGVSGPIAGIIITIPVLIIGIYLSHITLAQPGSLIFVPPLLVDIVSYFVAPQVPAGYILHIHPVAFAGWVGIIVTMLNLMPVAFLDGGHISRSLFNEKNHLYISIAGIIITLYFQWYMMAGIMAFFMLLMFRKHPGALDNVSKLSKNRKILAILTLVIFILCLSPAPQIV